MAEDDERNVFCLMNIYVTVFVLFLINKGLKMQISSAWRRATRDTVILLLYDLWEFLSFAFRAKPSSDFVIYRCYLMLQ